MRTYTISIQLKLYTYRCKKYPSRGDICFMNYKISQFDISIVLLEGTLRRFLVKQIAFDRVGPAVPQIA